MNKKNFCTLLVIMTFLTFSVLAASIRPTHASNALKSDTIYTISPSVAITDPPYPPTIYTNKIIVKGTTSDSGSGVQKVEAFVHTFPFNGDFQFKSTTPIAPGNWSKWSFPLFINTTGTYRIVVRATDNAGNQNWAET